VSTSTHASRRHSRGVLTKIGNATPVMEPKRPVELLGPNGSLDLQTTTQIAEWRGKRLFDLAVVLFSAPFVIVMVGTAAVLILLMEGRPVFFVQERVGLQGRLFRMVKLRTMTPNSNCNAIATQVGDLRVTRIGACLRNHRVDELPQFWNILCGNMSLIGPRPELPTLVESYSEALPNFSQRHLARPGITGLAQVSCGYAGNLSETRRKLHFDLRYVKRVSFKLDLYILVKTFLTVIRGSGVR
jgi:lipopolysaccharide/colanic/teichoic acid biosynthesis glycosyltransferase